jgi:hypothetical protein
VTVLPPGLFVNLLSLLLHINSLLTLSLVGFCLMDKNQLLLAVVIITLRVWTAFAFKRTEAFEGLTLTHHLDS